MTRPSLISALLLSLEALAFPRVAAAQQPERLQLSATGGAYLLAPGAFAQAFNHGPTLGLMTTVHLVGRLSVRATVDHDWLPYDRARFFQNLSLTPIDLNSQLGAAAELTTWSVGPELRLWRTPSLRLYSFSALGRGSRSTTTGPLVTLYCEPPSVVVDPDGTIHAPSGWVAPSGCDQAVAETAVEGSGGVLAIGFGLRWRYRIRTVFSLEAGYVRSLVSPASGAFPVRFGYGFTF